MKTSRMQNGDTLIDLTQPSKPKSSWLSEPDRDGVWERCYAPGAAKVLCLVRGAKYTELEYLSPPAPYFELDLPSWFDVRPMGTSAVWRLVREF